MAQKRFSQRLPSQSNYLILGGYRLRPRLPEVSGTGESRLNLCKLQVTECRIDCALNFLLQPAGHRYVVGVYTGLIISKFALQEQVVTGTIR